MRCVLYGMCVVRSPHRLYVCSAGAVLCDSVLRYYGLCCVLCCAVLCCAVCCMLHAVLCAARVLCACLSCLYHTTLLYDAYTPPFLTNLSSQPHPYIHWT